MIRYFSLLLFLFISINGFSQVQGQSFCAGVDDGEYFPLNIQEKKIYWYNTYYIETREGTKIVNGETYYLYNQTWENGSVDQLLLREESGNVYQYTEKGDILRYSNSLKVGDFWDATPTKEYIVSSYDAELKTPYCRYSNLLELKTNWNNEVYMFYYLRGYGYVGAKVKGELVSFVTPNN